METVLIKRAYEYAYAKHDGQTRKNSGAPYISHPIAVAEISTEIARSRGSSYAELEIIYIVALLHDVVEDTDTELSDIANLFNKDCSEQFVTDIVDAVDALTKRDGETYLDSIRRVLKNSVARIVKTADLTHNMSDLKPGSLRDKYGLARYILENF